MCTIRALGTSGARLSILWALGGDISAQVVAPAFTANGPIISSMKATHTPPGVVHEASLSRPIARRMWRSVTITPTPRGADVRRRPLPPHPSQPPGEVFDGDFAGGEVREAPVVHVEPQLEGDERDIGARTEKLADDGGAAAPGAAHEYRAEILQLRFRAIHLLLVPDAPTRPPVDGVSVGVTLAGRQR